MRAFLKAAALALVVTFAVTLMPSVAAFAQDASSSIAVPATTGDTIVTVPLGDWTTQVLDVVGAILLGLVSLLVATAARFLPGWLRPLVTASVQAAIANFVRQGIAYAIQEVEGFDKDKTISLDVGNAAVASALRYVIEHAPDWLVGLAGGKDAIAEKIIAFLGEHGIVLDSGVAPAQVASTAVKATG